MLIINQIFITFIAISGLLLAIKYFQKSNIQKAEKRRISYKWLLWFSKYDMYSTTSNDYRRYMKASNGLSIAFWLSTSIICSNFFFYWAM